MSSDFYFRKWREAIINLEEIVHQDLDYQTTKAHDKKRCDAALRLSSMLGQYLTAYNQIMECMLTNLQVQKTSYIEEAVKAVVARILELKHELSTLEASEHQFLNNGLIFHRLTTCDAELTEIPSKAKRPAQIQNMFEEVVERANERKRHIEELKLLEEREVVEEHVVNWWDEECKSEKSKNSTVVEKEEEISEKQKDINKNIQIIQAHEKSRQVIKWRTHLHNRRQRWQKELEGVAAPAAPYEIRERSAAIIQKVCRAYFECKRQRHLKCKRDELLGLRQCIKPKKDAQEKVEKIKAEKSINKGKFVKEWKLDYDTMKERFLKFKGDEIRESYRDYIRHWFQIWFEEIKLFHDIPHDKKGGSKLILKEELPSPLEWIEEYKIYMAERKSKKGKSAIQLKYEKMDAKHQQAMDKKGDLQKKRMENELKKIIMKNPTLHPGFNYPESKKTDDILKFIQEYHADWDEFDKKDQLDVKERHCKVVDRNKAIMEVKMEVIPQIDEDMRKELKKLKVALKKDYQKNEEEMPEPMKKKRKRVKKKCVVKIKTTISEHLAEKMEELVFRGFIKEYPRTKLEDFIGDPNFAGDDIRCNNKSALQMHGETRSIWWEKCRDMVHGFHRILLVGPKGGGKTVLLHALASLNDAILFELDPGQIHSELASDVYLEQIVQYIVSCAKAAQPSVIHIKHVQQFYYKKLHRLSLTSLRPLNPRSIFYVRIPTLIATQAPFTNGQCLMAVDQVESKKKDLMTMLSSHWPKVPPQAAEINLELFKRHFTKKLFKKIHKTDKITVIGSCIDPWLTKSKKMLKQFPNVVLLPNTSYSTVVQMLNDWVLSNHVVPSDFNVSSLAHVLQGYSFGYLKQFLEKFLSPERITRIPVHGLSPKEVYDTILDDDEEKIDYAKYLKWYSDRTSWGKREVKHLEEQREFEQALEKWELKMEMEKRKSAKPTSNKL